MNNLTATDIVLIIGAIGLLLTNTIAAFAALKSKNTALETSSKVDIHQEANSQKLDDIKISANGNMSRMIEKVELLEKKSIVDTESVHVLQDIVKNLTTGSSVNIVDPNKK